MTPWTRLEGTELWDHTKHMYADSRLKYHNFDHVIDLYRYAEELKFGYDKALDLAILLHDVIYDHLPGRELRSMVVCLTLGMSNQDIASVCEVGKAVELIGTTSKHTFKVSDPRLVILDLYSFTDQETASMNSSKIAQENVLLYPDYSPGDLIRAQKDFLKVLHAQLDSSLYSNQGKINDKKFNGIPRKIVEGLGDFLK